LYRYFEISIQIRTSLVDVLHKGITSHIQQEEEEEDGIMRHN